MTDTPEMAEWLNRIILGSKNSKGHGEKDTLKGLTSLGKARQLLYEDLKYDITRKQFEGLQDALNNMPVESGLELKQEFLTHKVLKNGKPTGEVRIQTVYRNKLGQFSKH